MYIYKNISVASCEARTRDALPAKLRGPTQKMTKFDNPKP